METSLYIVDGGSRENAEILRKHWLAGSVAVEDGRGTKLLAPLTEDQAYTLERQHGFSVTPAPKT